MSTVIFIIYWAVGLVVVTRSYKRFLRGLGALCPDERAVNKEMPWELIPIWAIIWPIIAIGDGLRGE